MQSSGVTMLNAITFAYLEDFDISFYDTFDTSSKGIRSGE